MVIGLFAAAAAALACPHPWMPLGAGSSWTYSFSDGREVALTVKSVSTHEGWEVATVDSSDGDERIAEVSFSCSPDGLDLGFAAAFSGGSETLKSEGVALLPASKLVPGATWTSSRTGREGRVQFQHSVASLRSVTVKAGVFDALEVDVTPKGAPGASAHLWFAKGVGLVKLGIDGGFTAELTRYDARP